MLLQRKQQSKTLTLIRKLNFSMFLTYGLGLGLRSQNKIQCAENNVNSTSYSTTSQLSKLQQIIALLATSSFASWFQISLTFTLSTTYEYSRHPDNDLLYLHTKSFRGLWSSNIYTTPRFCSLDRLAVVAFSSFIRAPLAHPILFASTLFVRSG